MVPLSRASLWNQWPDLSESVTSLEAIWPPWLCHGEDLGGVGLVDGWILGAGVPASASSRS